ISRIRRILDSSPADPPLTFSLPAPYLLRILQGLNSHQTGTSPLWRPVKGAFSMGKIAVVLGDSMEKAGPEAEHPRSKKGVRKNYGMGLKSGESRIRTCEG